MIRVLRINPIPTLRDGKIRRREEAGNITKQQAVDFLFVENIHAHLQLDARESGASVCFRKERFEIVAAASDRAIGFS
jgi:hypothetical protein